MERIIRQFYFYKYAYVFTIIVALFHLQSFAQPDSTTGKYFIDAKLHGGFLIAHRPSLIPLQQQHLTGFDVSAGVFTNGNKAWHRHYNFPALGIKYSFLKSGNEQVLGNTHALLPFIDVTFTKKSRTKFGLQFGWGIGYVTNKFSQFDNYKNVAIGSGLNTAVNLNLFLRRKAGNRNFISAGVGVMHFSNGSVVTPNLGINLASAQLCYRFSMGTKKEIQNADVTHTTEWEHSAAMVFGVKQNYPALGENFFIRQFSFMSLRQYHPVAAYGLGFDLPYDPSITQRLDNRGANTNSLTAFRPGVNIGYQIKMGNINLMLQQGFYVYSQLTDDGILYHRLSVRYHIGKHYFAAFNLKAHFAKADYFEWGGGVRF